MHINTPNARAFELVGDALVALDGFQQSKELQQLEKATSHLQEALKEDPKYLRAIYYMGVAEDLIGKPKDAVEKFREVLNGLESVSLVQTPAFPIEVQYNLGTAYYHCYSQEELDKAAEHFTLVTNRTEDKEKTIRNLAYASLAQTYAQRMIHRINANYYADKAEEEAKKALNDIRTNLICKFPNFFSFISFKPIERETFWIAYNARGLAAMYRSDDFSDFNKGTRSYEEKMKDLEQAENYFKTALRYSPNNWAIYCNLGSTHMRRGYWMKQEQGKSLPFSDEFDKARKSLLDVTERIKPNYGFALYEIGRTYRLQGEWSEAINRFEQALDIEESSRNVSTKRVERELSLAEKKDDTFLLSPLS